MYYNKPMETTHLEKLIKSRDPRDRKKALSLAAKQDPAPLPPLIAALEDEDNTVRCAALKALGKIRAVEAVDSILLLLQDEKWYAVRAAAWKALKRIDQATYKVTREKAGLTFSERFAVHFPLIPWWTGVILFASILIPDRRINMEFYRAFYWKYVLPAALVLMALGLLLKLFSVIAQKNRRH
ncbi:MAG: HEAT repeat domain-containing protein [bacterium]|nr:HEAT repeat domain-containing protein [bacterium]